MHKYQKVYEYYLQKSQEAINLFSSPKILKLDVYNELMAAPIEGGIAKNLKTLGKIFLIDYDQNSINQVKEKFPELDIIKGDIKNIPFPDRNFDVLLDLSTIDHINPLDLPKVIFEYSRVLKIGGMVLIIAWFSKKPNIKWSSDVYPLYLPYLKKLLNGKFKILKEEICHTEEKGFIYSILARKLPWLHLQTDSLDARYLIAAGYLANKVSGKYIIDLNCGTARLLKYIPHTFALYYGNDILIDIFPNYKNVLFEKIIDQEVVNKYNKKLDILLVFGYASGHLAKNKWESETLDQSTRDLIKKFEPEIIILDSSYDYEIRFATLKNLIGYIQAIDGYKIVHSIKLSPINNTELAERIVYILEK